MYIRNPTKEMLESWFPAKRQIIVEYFMVKKIPIVHIDKKIVYFAKTEEWQKAFDEMPWWLKVLII